MTSLQKTAFVVVLTVTTGAMPIRAASAVGAETNAATESDDLSAAVADSSLAITLGFERH